MLFQTSNRRLRPLYNIVSVSVIIIIVSTFISIAKYVYSNRPILSQAQHTSAATYAKVVVQSPNGGEAILAGTATQVKWQYSAGSADKVTYPLNTTICFALIDQVNSLRNQHCVSGKTNIGNNTLAVILPANITLSNKYKVTIEVKTLLPASGGGSAYPKDISDKEFSVHRLGALPLPTPTPTPRRSFTDCSQYPQKRIFLETQAWWMDTKSTKTILQTPLNGIGGHAHTATCFPQDQFISGGILHFDMRLMLHKGNIGKVTYLNVEYGPNGTEIVRKNLNITCPGALDMKVMCEQWVGIDVDTAKIPAGYQELRFKFNVEQPNGERQFASTGWQAYFRTQTGGLRKPPFLEARGWYTDTGYTNVRLTSAVPYTPLAGIQTFRVETLPGADGIPITDYGVHIDARFNYDDFGKTLKQGTQPFKGDIELDTRTLTNGTHCFAIRASANHLKSGGTNTGILQFPILINNPGAKTQHGKGSCSPET